MLTEHRARAVFLEAMFNRPVSVVDRLEVIVFASRLEFAEITRLPTTLGYHNQDAFGRERIVLAGGLGSDQGAVVAHELAHRLTFQFLRLRSLPLAPGSADPGRRDLFLAVSKDGEVAEIVSRDGDPLPAAVAALRGTPHGIALPADAPPMLVVPATTACDAGRCAVVLGAQLEEPAAPRS